MDHREKTLYKCIVLLLLLLLLLLLSSWITWFALNNQSKERHVVSIVNYPIKTPPRAFYCALPNQTMPRFSIVHFAAQEKKPRRSKKVYTGLPVVRVTLQNC